MSTSLSIVSRSQRAPLLRLYRVDNEGVFTQQLSFGRQFAMAVTVLL
jgi:hypothetical protein